MKNKKENIEELVPHSSDKYQILKLLLFFAGWYAMIKVLIPLSHIINMGHF